MPSKVSTARAPPPIGTLIDNGTLELTEVLGVGGYGVVYRAIDTRSRKPKTYAVKCLIQSQSQQSSRQRQLHLREITLHQLASAHPGVITLHRVVEESNHTYIVMEYAGDGDLFGQILNNCRYLGNDGLIKHVFLQMLDAVEYCHSLGIYHRDLKPENILCFDDGLRTAITDFGLATTERFSEEFRTGSIYHMSPGKPLAYVILFLSLIYILSECQGGVFAPTGTYSPLFNDIWSLAIILLNLATGRNPWKSASASDPTFQAYLADPANFLPTVLPISAEANAVLVRMLEVDWRHRMTLSEVRVAIEDIDTFYSDGVAFEGSMARCPWEVGVEIESESEESTKGEPEELPEQHEFESKSDLKSYWSGDSDLEMGYTSPSAATQDASWMDYSSCTLSSFDRSGRSRSRSPSPPPAGSYPMYDAPSTPPSTYSPLSARSSLPSTPEGIDIPMEYRSEAPRRKPLRVDTDFGSGRFFEGCIATIDSGSVMQTAVESAITDPFSFFLENSPRKSAASMEIPSSVDLGSPVTMTKEVVSTSSWGYSADEEDASSSYSHPSMSTSRANSILGLEGEFDVEDMVISPNVQFCTEASSASSVNTVQHPPVIPAFTLFRENSADTPPSFQAPPHANATKKPADEKPKSAGLFSSIRLQFPRSPRASSISDSSQSQESNFSDSFIPLQTLGQSASGTTTVPTLWHMRSSPKPMTLPINIPEPNCRRDARLLRSRRHWFSPGKLFTAGAS